MNRGRSTTARPESHRDKSHRSSAGKPGLATRQAATRLLAAVIDRRVSLDGMLDPVGGNPAYLALADNDRGLVRAIVTTALRRRAAVDAAIAGLIDKPLPDGARSLRFILECAATQILYLDVPDRAAVDLAVEQAQADPRSRRFAGLVNAVLRRLAREKDAIAPRIETVAAAVPEWFRNRLAESYGEAAPTILRMLAEPPAIDLTVKHDPQLWAERLGGVVLPTGSVRLSAIEGAITDLPGYDEGAWWVQDAAAALPVRLFGDLAGLFVADLCAAPGGKTAQLVHAGATVTAFDRSENRMERLRQNLARLRLTADCHVCDMMQGDAYPQFDAVLLDAPCSSTGTVRRHPDVLWTKTPDEIARLVALQTRMLRRAAAFVRPGGRIVFSNCSLDPAEGEEVVASVCAEDPRLVVEPATSTCLRGLENAIRADGTVRTTPEMLPAEPKRLGGLDGFFAAVIRVES